MTRAIQRCDPPPEYGRDPRYRDGVAIMDREARIREVAERVSREAPRNELGDGKRWKDERRRKRKKRKAVAEATLFALPARESATLFEMRKETA
jgi:hypothetical protein